MAREHKSHNHHHHHEHKVDNWNWILWAIVIVVIFGLLAWAIWAGTNGSRDASEKDLVALGGILDGEQEVPVCVDTPAHGVVSAALNEHDKTLTYSIVVDDLCPSDITAAHFHGPAPAGENAGVLKDIHFDGNTAVGIWSSKDKNQPLTKTIMKYLKQDLVYVNIHSVEYPAGILRSQLTNLSN